MRGLRCQRFTQWRTRACGLPHSVSRLSTLPWLGFLPPGAWSPRRIYSSGVACPAAPRPRETSPCHSCTAPLSPAGESPRVTGADTTKGSPSSKACLGSPPPPPPIYYTTSGSASHCHLATRENQDPPLSTSCLPFPTQMESATKPTSCATLDITLPLFPRDSPLCCDTLPFSLEIQGPPQMLFRTGLGTVALDVHLSAPFCDKTDLDHTRVRLMQGRVHGSLN